MHLKHILLLLVTGVSITSLGMSGCTPLQRNLNPEVQAPNLIAQTTAPTNPVQERPGDVPYVPTPQPVVDAMLKLGKVGKDDLLYDLGSGDGRIVITAAKRYGTRGVGIDINPERIQEANENARKAGVSDSEALLRGADRVQFIQQDLFKTDLSKATVVTLYLLPEINLKLRPKLLRELKPGTRIVSHAFDMGDWKPQQTLQVEGKTIYYWVVPQQVPANLR